VERTKPLSGFFRETSAPGTTAPDVSLTTPLISDVLTCAQSIVANSTKLKRQTILLIFIGGLRYRFVVWNGRREDEVVNGNITASADQRGSSKNKRPS